MLSFSFVPSSGSNSSISPASSVSALISFELASSSDAES